ncbi:MAG: hypothetical protein AAF488_04790 [Planctomycetota bacterium]
MTSTPVESPSSDSPPPAVRSWLKATVGLTVVSLVVIVALGLSLHSWVQDNQAVTLYRFADDYEEMAELSRQEGSIGSEYRTLATRAKADPLPFLEFGVLVILHRDYLADGRLDSSEITRQRSVIRDILDDKFDPATATDLRSTTP